MRASRCSATDCQLRRDGTSARCPNPSENDRERRNDARCVDDDKHDKEHVNFKGYRDQQVLRTLRNCHTHRREGLTPWRGQLGK